MITIQRVLGRRAPRRLAVVAVLVATAVLGSSLPPSLHGFAMAVVLFITIVDLVLIDATRALAFGRRKRFDEREQGLRDLAYRRGFRLLGLSLAAALLLAIAGAMVTGPFGAGPQPGVVEYGVAGRTLAAIIELLVMMPTLVIAWVEGDRDAGDDGVSTRSMTASWWLVVPALVATWLVTVALLPEQSAGRGSSIGEVSVTGASCTDFAGGRVTGAEFGATVGMRAEVCWNGTDAFVFGDPAIPLPPSAVQPLLAQLPPDDRTAVLRDLNPAQPDLTACGADNLQDFATVTQTTCTASIDSAGTLHYAVHAHVAALPFSIAARDVTLDLVVDRHGNVLQRP